MKKLIIVMLVITSMVLLSLNVIAEDCGCSHDDTTFVIIDAPQIGTLTTEVLDDLKKQSEEEDWSFNVGENSVIDLSLDQLCGLVEPENWQEDVIFDPCDTTEFLPDRYDWRELGGCTSIKNQDSCGSCWAFGTVAPLECNILIHDGVEVDLSEQWLVSCNTDGWGCGGGWYAHKYHMDTHDRFGDAGAVLEEYFPYEAEDLPCNGPYPHSYQIDSWRYIGFGGVPSVDSIKNAIITYGPVSVGVAVDSAFGAYTEGVFYSDCDELNHAVALVGWDDNYYWNGEYYGVWILRNSWGPGWGQGGYMYILYNSSRVGYGACYVKYPVSTEIEISGGFGAFVGIKNVGIVNSNNIKCKISAYGGLLNMIDTTIYKNTSSLKPGEMIQQNLPLNGLGMVEVKATAKPYGKAEITKTVKFFSFFGIGLIIG